MLNEQTQVNARNTQILTRETECGIRKICTPKYVYTGEYVLNFKTTKISSMLDFLFNLIQIDIRRSLLGRKRTLG